MPQKKSEKGDYYIKEQIKRIKKNRSLRKKGLHLVMIQHNGQNTQRQH